MLHSKSRLFTTLVTAIALFGAGASAADVTLAANKDGLKLRPGVAAQAIDTDILQKVNKPDLRVKSWTFGPDNGAKYVKVILRNNGIANAQPSVLRLTVRRINGAPVGRTVDVNVPAFVGQADYAVSVATANILPNDVQLKDTTFRLDADANNSNAELNEANNTSWHNL